MRMGIQKQDACGPLLHSNVNKRLAKSAKSQVLQKKENLEYQFQQRANFEIKNLVNA